MLRAALLLSVIALARPVSVLGQEDPPKGEVLNVYCWENYFAATTLSDFEKEFGCKIELRTYASNEELEEKLLSGLLGMDVIFPSDYMVKKLYDQNVLGRLDTKKIPNLKNIAQRFLKLPYDRNNNYSVPYMWGTTGLAVNRTKVTGKVDTLAILFDPRYKGRIAMLDDPRSGIGMALKYLGKSVNSRKKEDLQAVRELLLKQKELVAKYDSEKYTDSLLDGSIYIAMGYGGDVLTAREKDKSIFYFVPEEGTILWTDNVCVLKGSEHVELAQNFINYLLRPEVSAAITNETFFASPNEAAEKLVKPDILHDRTIFPPKKVMDKSEFLDNIGSAQETYDAIWKEVTGE